MGLWSGEASLRRGSLAQLVEQRTFNPQVAGSNPARPFSDRPVTACVQTGGCTEVPWVTLTELLCNFVTKNPPRSLRGWKEMRLFSP